MQPNALSAIESPDIIPVSCFGGMYCGPYDQSLAMLALLVSVIGGLAVRRWTDLPVVALAAATAMSLSGLVGFYRAYGVLPMTAQDKLFVHAAFWIDFYFMMLAIAFGAHTTRRLAIVLYRFFVNQHS
ncbi:MAG: hypothetical protein ABL973_12830 [Micropepsaceae bacterium]